MQSNRGELSGKGQPIPAVPDAAILWMNRGPHLLSGSFLRAYFPCSRAGVGSSYIAAETATVTNKRICNIFINTTYQRDGLC